MTFYYDIWNVNEKSWIYKFILHRWIWISSDPSLIKYNIFNILGYLMLFIFFHYYRKFDFEKWMNYFCLLNFVCCLNEWTERDIIYFFRFSLILTFAVCLCLCVVSESKSPYQLRSWVYYIRLSCLQFSLSIIIIIGLINDKPFRIVICFTCFCLVKILMCVKYYLLYLFR